MTGYAQNARAVRQGTTVETPCTGSLPVGTPSPGAGLTGIPDVEGHIKREPDMVRLPLSFHDQGWNGSAVLRHTGAEATILPVPLRL